MSDQFWLSEKQLARIKPHFPLSHGVPRVDDRKVISGIIHVIRNGLRWRDAPAVYGPHKTLYNRFIRWSKMRVPIQPAFHTDPDANPLETPSGRSNGFAILLRGLTVKEYLVRLRLPWRYNK